MLIEACSLITKGTSLDIGNRNISSKLFAKNYNKKINLAVFRSNDQENSFMFQVKKFPSIKDVKFRRFSSGF